MVIIAADDEKLALECLTDAIREVVPDGEIHSFRNPEETLTFAKEHSCDIAFLDIEMRGTNGIELAKKMKLINPKINIIFTTGYSDYMGDAFSLHASGYIMKPVTPEKIRAEMENLRHPVMPPEKKRIRIKTFGNFEVFVDGQPVKSQYNKTKELLAYLVDRNGSLCGNAEIADVLWEEDGIADHNSYLKAIKSDLLSMFEKLGCEDILVRQRGKIGLRPEKVDCDYFDWLAGKPYAINAYRGEYMIQYSWSEFTHGSIETTVAEQKEVQQKRS